MKLRPVSDGVSPKKVIGYSFYCQGCEHVHVFWTAGQLTWDFDDNLTSPTFSPSLLNTCDNHPDPKQRRCHLFLRAGRIEYCSDCTHDLAGQTVEMHDHWPDP